MVERLFKILVVDDEQNMRIAMFEAMKRGGHEVSVAENGRMALDIILKNPPDLVITDIRMPEMNGIELLRKIKEIRPELPVVIITGYATIDTAVEAMKLGAFDYILKPFPVEVIEDIVARVFATLERRETDLPVLARKAAPVLSRAIIGSDDKFLNLLRKADAVASSKATVLILGESGTGKEIFARFIHEKSDRRNGPFVALNCAALPEGLLESELFGHEKGAFTGAVINKKGKFELADHGTLLLDEIGEIPLHLQAKLLRVLQEEEVDRLGGKAPVTIDVHVVATTNRSLEKAVQEGSFRQDLFYRLNVIPLRLPPLRERKGDILPLADHFIEKFSTQYNKPIRKLSPASRQRFLAHAWPGNVREMENLIERAVLLAVGDFFDPWDFWDEEESPTQLRQAVEVECGPTDVAGVEPTCLKDAERQMILQALQKTDNNRTHAAKMLGISVRTLRNKLAEYRGQGDSI